MRSKWGKIWQRSACLSALLFISSSCGIATSPSNTSAVTTFSSTDQTTPTFVYGLYKIDATTHESSYVGTIVRGPSGFEWPASTASYFAGLVGGSKIISYVVKAYAPSPETGSNGDYYYELPVTSKTLSFNGASTAVWWALKQSLAAQGQPTRLNTATWENLLFVLDSYCPNCLVKAGSSSYQLIKTDPTLRTEMNSVLSEVGSAGLSTTAVGLSKLGIAYSNPALVNGAVSLTSIQGDTVSLQAVFYDPLKTDTRATPDSWDFLAAPLVTPNSLALPSPDLGKITFFFDYMHHGAETITASRTGVGAVGSVTFNYGVTINELPPVYSGPTFSLRANHLTTIDVATYTTDPQGLPMTYSLLNAPNGVTLSGSVLSWNPTQEPSTQVGAAAMIVQISDTDGNVAAATVTVNVLADHYPEFATLPPSPWNVQEGTMGTLTFDTVDLDGDPIELTCIDSASVDCATTFFGANPDGSLVPSGSNWPSLAAPNPAIYTGTPGMQTVVIPFTPSYRQTIATNASYNVLMSINYPYASALTLRRAYLSASKSVTVNVQNIADPPTWGTQPGPNPTPAPTELIAMTPMAGGAATDAAINPGPHTITYTVDPLTVVASPGSASNCSWITVNSSTGQITGTPPYTSAGTCKFAVKAMDPLGIYTDSNLQTLTIVNVPRPITPAGSIPDQTATELVQFSLNLSSYFNDADQTAGDPREAVMYSCTNCAALGIAGYSFGGATFNWKPPIGTTTTTGSRLFSAVNILATNTGGFTANQAFNLTVNGAPGPMVIGFANDTLAVAGGATPSVTMTALATGSIKVVVSNMAGDTSNYPYSIISSCAPTCSIALDTLNSNSGTGATIFTLSLAPSASDGYGGIAYASNLITVTFTVAANNGSTTLVTTANLNLFINTVDRPATGLSVNSDGGTGPYALAINGSAFSPNTLPMRLISPDIVNDSVSYAFKTTTYPVFGTLTGSNWTFNPLGSGCIPGTGTTTKTFEITGTSDRTPTVTFTRTITATISNALLGVGGSCPY